MRSTTKNLFIPSQPFHRFSCILCVVITTQLCAIFKFNIFFIFFFHIKINFLRNITLLQWHNFLFSKVDCFGYNFDFIWSIFYKVCIDSEFSYNLKKLCSTTKIPNMSRVSNIFWTKSINVHKINIIFPLGLNI